MWGEATAIHSISLIFSFILTWCYRRVEQEIVLHPVGREGNVDGKSVSR